MISSNTGHRTRGITHIAAILRCSGPRADARERARVATICPLLTAYSELLTAYSELPTALYRADELLVDRAVDFLLGIGRR
jgi:hypothetical protein